MSAIVSMLIPVIAGGIVYYTGKAADYSQLVERLTYSFKVKFNISGSGLTIKLDFLLYNPTDNNVKITYPLIQLFNGNSLITQNRVLNDTYTLKAKSQLTIPNITFNLGWFTLASLVSANAKDIINAYSNGTFDAYLDKLKKQLSFTASLEVNGIPITYKDSVLGYSPISAIDRPIMAAPQFDKYFPLPEGKKEIVIKDGEVEDTVRMMHKIVRQDAHLVRDAAQLFASASVYETAQKIFDFVYKYLKYNLEEGEQLRNPVVTYHLGQRLAREFYDKNGYYSPDYAVDCDDISIFVASILYNLGIKYAFRIASYNGANYSHVYVIAFDENNEPIIIDPVYYRFNEEKNYTKEKTFDTKMNELGGIPVYYLNGTEDGNDNVYQFLNYLDSMIKPTNGNNQSAEVLHQLLDYVIKYWNTDQRNTAIEIAMQKERELKDIIYNSCPNELLFEELHGYINSELGELGKFTDFFKNEMEKIKKHFASKKAQQVQVVQAQDGQTSQTASSNYTNTTAKKTLRDIIAKYKVPLAIGTMVATGGIIVATSPKLQKKFGLKK